MAGAKTMRRTAAAFAVAISGGLGVVAIAGPAGAATTAHAGCSYYTPEDCVGGGDDTGGYPTDPGPSTPTHTPMIDPGLIGLAAASIGGGAGGLVLRKRARRA
jgi:hypothetical protein